MPMGFIMPYLRSISYSQDNMYTRINKLILALCCFTATHFAQAEGIVISQVSSNLVEDVYQLDARLEFNFEAEVIDALEHGVSISIDIIILIKRKRSWLWDPKIKEEILSFRLEQHPLSNRYLVTNLANNYRQQFLSLDDALEFLGTIKDHFLISQTVLLDDEDYICMIKAELSTETLPPVIRPLAFVSKKWRMDSPWYRWLIRE